MYFCDVLEFGVAIEIALTDRIMLTDCYSIYDDKACVLKNIDIDRFNDVVRIDDKAIWISYLSNSQYVYTDMIEFSSLNTILTLPHEYSNSIARVGDKFFGVRGRREKTKIICISHLNDNIEVNIPRLKQFIFSYKEYVYAFGLDGGVFCFDSNLKLIWESKNHKSVSSPNLNIYHPIFIDNLILCNLGEDACGEYKFYVCAYDVSSGRVIWSLALGSMPQSSFLVNSYLYVATKNLFYKVNAINGYIEIKHEFFYETFDGKEAAISAVYPVKDGLLCFNHQNHFVEVRSEDAKTVLQTIRLPETYSYAFLSSPPVLEHNGKYYFKLDHLVLGLNPMKSAVAVLTPDANAPKNYDAVLESRPPHSIDIIKEKSGKNEHLVKMKGDDHDKVLRYAHVVLKEIAFRSGVTRLFEFDSRDKNHGGILNLEIDTSELKEKQSLGYWEDFFGVIKHRVESELKDSHILAGDGESNFHVNVHVK